MKTRIPFIISLYYDSIEETSNSWLDVLDLPGELRDMDTCFRLKVKRR